MGRAMPSRCADTIFIHKNVKCLFDGAAHADWNEWDNPTFLTLTRTELNRRARTASPYLTANCRRYGGGGYRDSTFETAERKSAGKTDDETERPLSLVVRA